MNKKYKICSFWDGIEDCSVCLAEFVKRDKIYRTECLHYYHKKCLDEWLKNHRTCPICRTIIQRPKTNYEQHFPALGENDNNDLPLSFYYHRDTSVALPIVALSYNQQRITFNIEEFPPLS